MENRLEVRKEIRKRMLEQSIHLSNRTTNFLLANSILIAGTQFNKYDEIPWWLVSAGFFIALLWLLTSIQSRAIIKRFKINYQVDNDEVDKLQDKKKWCILLRPTDIFAIYIPLIFLAVWIFLLFNLFCKI